MFNLTLVILIMCFIREQYFRYKYINKDYKAGRRDMIVEIVKEWNKDLNLSERERIEKLHTLLTKKLNE